MEKLENRIVQLQKAGLNCCQVMVQLSFELRGIDEPDVIESLLGFGFGMQSQHICGTLSGGCYLLSSYTEVEPALRKEMVKSYVSWFEEKFGSLLCRDLVHGDRMKIAEFCPGLIRKNFEQCLKLLSDNGIDPEA